MHDDENLTDEVWHEVLSFPDYEVSSTGKVRKKAYTDRDGRQRQARMLKPSLINVKSTASNRMSRGPYVRVRDGDAFYAVAIASLMVEAFKEPLDHRRYRIGFHDGDPTNTTLENLKIEPRGEDTARGAILRRLRALRGMADY